MKRHDVIWWIGTLLSAAAAMAAFTVGLRDSGAGFLGFALVSIVVLGLRDLLYASQHRSLRQDWMRQAAGRLGFSFRQTAPGNVLGWPQSIRLTCEAMKLQQVLEQSPFPFCSSVLVPTSRNVMEGTVDNATVAIFDYQCDGSNRSEITIRQTVFAARSTDLPTSRFSLVPASSWDRLVDRFGASGAIQHRYRLISDGSVQFRDFDERLFACLDGQMTLEAGGGCMLLYRRDRLVAPEELDAFLATGLQIYTLVCGIEIPTQ
jgi:hypothetical protein